MKTRWPFLCTLLALAVFLVPMPVLATTTSYYASQMTTISTAVGSENTSWETIRTSTTLNGGTFSSSAPAAGFRKAADNKYKCYTGAMSFNVGSDFNSAGRWLTGMSFTFYLGDITWDYASGGSSLNYYLVAAGNHSTSGYFANSDLASPVFGGIFLTDAFSKNSLSAGVELSFTVKNDALSYIHPDAGGYIYIYLVSYAQTVNTAPTSTAGFDYGMNVVGMKTHLVSGGTAASITGGGHDPQITVITTAADILTPAAPTDLTASMDLITIGAIEQLAPHLEWAWTGETGPGISYYQAQRATDDAFTQGVTTYDVTNPTWSANKEYWDLDAWANDQLGHYYRVRVVNIYQSSYYYSSWSNTATLSSTQGTVPTTPTNLAAEIVNRPVGLFDQDVPKLTWSWTDTAQTGVFAYQMQRATNSGFSQNAESYTILASDPDAINKIWYDLYGWAANYQTTNYYRLRVLSAIDHSTFSSWSNTATLTTGVPGAPTNLTAAVGKSGNANVINLTWTDNATTEAKFWIQRDNNANFTTCLTLESVANSTSYQDSYNLGTLGSMTYYRIAAVTAGNVPSAWSNTAQVNTANIIGTTPPTTGLPNPFDGLELTPWMQLAAVIGSCILVVIIVGLDSQVKQYLVLVIVSTIILAALIAGWIPVWGWLVIVLALGVKVMEFLTGRSQA